MGCFFSSIIWITILICYIFDCLIVSTICFIWLINCLTNVQSLFDSPNIYRIILPKMSDFFTRLSQLAEYYGVTKPSEFAKKTGFSHQTASNYLKGDRTPTLDAITKIQQAFESLSLEWLIDGKGNMLITPASEIKEVISEIRVSGKSIAEIERENEFLRQTIALKDEIRRQDIELMEFLKTQVKNDQDLMKMLNDRIKQLEADKK